MVDKDTVIGKYLDKDFLDSIYGFAYKRCNNSCEAEDLCSEIVVAILQSVRNCDSIDNFYAFTWTITHRKYADYCEKRRISSENIIPVDLNDGIISIKTDPIGAYIENEQEKSQIKRIKKEISFLARMYRDVMIMYYIDGMKISNIAKKLHTSETVIKQRLFSARNIIRKEVDKMDTKNISLKPIRMIWHGDGDPVKSHPYEKAERTFSQNVLYMCKDTPRTAKEISELLNIPMLFVEEELEIQCNGSNGSDGLLKKLDNGKYISTFIMLDYNDYDVIHSAVNRYLDRFVDKISNYIDEKKDKILSFSYLNKHEDLRFILWSLVNRMCWSMGWQLSDKIIAEYYSDIKLAKKDYYPFGFKLESGKCYSVDSYGCDGIDADNVCGYSHIHMCNIYGKRKEPHFHCGLNISLSAPIQMTIRAIGGLDIESLSENEKEIAAKAIETGYLKKEGDRLYPKILVIPFENSSEFYSFASHFNPQVAEFADEFADEFNKYIKKYLPSHLYDQVDKFISHTMVGFDSDVIEKCIDRGILYAPENSVCAEGTFMVVRK